MDLMGIIFDLDGVLVDSVPLHFKAWGRMFSEYGYEFDESIYRRKVDGRPRLDGVRNILTDVSDDIIQEASDLKQCYYLEMLEAGHLKTFPSTKPFVTELREHGVKMATASSSVNAKVILESIGLLKDFEVVVTADDISDGKPHPEIFLTAAERLGLSPNECLVLEDAESGVNAAKSGGFYCVGIDRHNQPSYFVNADLVVRDLSELSYESLCKLHKNRSSQSLL